MIVGNIHIFVVIKKTNRYRHLHRKQNYKNSLSGQRILQGICQSSAEPPSGWGFHQAPSQQAQPALQCRRHPHPFSFERLPLLDTFPPRIRLPSLVAHLPQNGLIQLFCRIEKEIFLPLLLSSTRSLSSTPISSTPASYSPLAYLELVLITIRCVASPFSKTTRSTNIPDDLPRKSTSWHPANAHSFS